MASENLTMELWEIIQKNNQEEISYNDFESDLNKAFNLPKDEVDRALAIMISQAEVNPNIIGEYKGGSFKISQSFAATITSTIKYENQFIPGKQEYEIREKGNVNFDDIGAILLTTEVADRLIENYENLSENERNGLIQNFSKLSYNQRKQINKKLRDSLDNYSKKLDTEDQNIAKKTKKKLEAVQEIDDLIEEGGIEAVIENEEELINDPNLVAMTQIEIIFETDEQGSGRNPNETVEGNGTKESQGESFDGYDDSTEGKILQSERPRASYISYGEDSGFLTQSNSEKKEQVIDFDTILQSATIGKNLINQDGIIITCINGEECNQTTLKELGAVATSLEMVESESGRLQLRIKLKDAIVPDGKKYYANVSNFERLTGKKIEHEKYERHLSAQKDQVVDESAKITTLLMVKSAIKMARETGNIDELKKIVSENMKTIISSIINDEKIEFTEEAIIEGLMSGRIIIELDKEKTESIVQKRVEERSEERRRDSRQKKESVLPTRGTSFKLIPPIIQEDSTQEPELSKSELLKKEMQLLKGRLKIKVGDEKAAQYLKKYEETLRETKELLDNFDLQDIDGISRFIEDSLKKEEVPDEVIEIFSKVKFSKELDILLTEEPEMFFMTFGKIIGKSDMYKIPESAMDRAMKEQGQELVVGSIGKNIFEQTNKDKNYDTEVKKVTTATGSNSDSDYKYLKDISKNGFNLKNIGSVISTVTSRKVEEATSEVNSLGRDDKDNNKEKDIEELNDDVPVQE